jgi:hypothetical protein
MEAQGLLNGTPFNRHEAIPACRRKDGYRM